MPEKLLTFAFATARPEDEARSYADYLTRTCGLPRSKVSALPYPSNRRSLCSVYNDALRRADGRYVALLHDDLSFEKARGWGRKLIRVFEQNPEFSVLGVAGSSILQESGNWFHPQVNCGHIYHRTDGKTELSRFSLPHPRPRPAAAMDGVFIMARTADVRGLELDQERFDHFHFYDVELCMQARDAGLKLGVTDAVDLIHLSMGDFGDEWESYRQRFVEKYGERLPSKAIGEADLFPFSKFTRKVKSDLSVAILIPTKDRVDLVRTAVHAIHSRTAPGIRYRIYILDTGSSPESLAQLKALPSVEVIELGYYNFAAIHNDVILKQRRIEEDLVLFHNNDVAFVNDTLSHMLHAWTTTRRPGVVGARLHFCNGLIQHAGVRIMANLEKSAFAPGHHGYQTLWNYHHDIRRGTTGNTFALALVERSLYEQLGGLNEDYEGCFEDVEFNLQAIRAGRSNVFVGDAVAIHAESATRNADRAKQARQTRDLNKLATFISDHLSDVLPKLEVEPPSAVEVAEQAAPAPRATEKVCAKDPFVAGGATV